jgi:hypothetical protein
MFDSPIRFPITSMQRGPRRFLSPGAEGAGSARGPLPALKNLLHREILRRLFDEFGDGLRLRNVDRMAASVCR